MSTPRLPAAEVPQGDRGRWLRQWVLGGLDRRAGFFFHREKMKSLDQPQSLRIRFFISTIRGPEEIILKTFLAWPD